MPPQPPQLQPMFPQAPAAQPVQQPFVQAPVVPMPAPGVAPLQPSPPSPIGWQPGPAPAPGVNPIAAPPQPMPGPPAPSPAVQQFAQQAFQHGAQHDIGPGVGFAQMGGAPGQPQPGQPQPPGPPMQQPFQPTTGTLMPPPTMTQPPSVFQPQPQLPTPYGPPPGVGMPPTPYGPPPGTLAQPQPQPPTSDAGLVEAIKAQSEAFKQVIEDNRTILQQATAGTGAAAAQQSHADVMAKWQTDRVKALETAETKLQETMGAGNYAEAMKGYRTEIEKWSTPPAQPTPAGGGAGLEGNVMLRSMQSDALGRAAKDDPFLHQTYGKEIKAELDKMPPEYQFSSEGVQRAESLVRGAHYNDLMQQQQQQWAQQQQYQQWQQYQQGGQIPPQSLPRPDLGESAGMNLYSLPAAARQVAYQMGIPLEEYARMHQQFHGYSDPSGAAAPTVRPVDSLEGAEGVPFIPEGEEAAMLNQQRAAAWQAQQMQYPQQPPQPGMYGQPNPYYWQPGVPNMPQQPY